MAGVKGRSGGARPGAGRKKKEPAALTAAAPARKSRPAKSKAPTVEMEPQAHGGALKREHKAPEVLAGIGEDGFDPRPALEQVALGLLDPSPAQMKALVALMPYVHTKRGEGGKKDERADKAKKAAGGKFRAAPAPLKLVGR